MAYDGIKERKEEIEQEVFQKELGELLLSQYRDEIDRQNETLREKEIRIETCKESVTSAYGEISTLGCQVLYWKQRVAVSEDQICKLACELECSKGEITRQNNIIAILQKERSEAMDGCRYYEAQIKRLKATYDELEDRVDALTVSDAIEANSLKHGRRLRTSRRVTSIFPASIHCSLVTDDVCQPKPFYAAKSYELAAQQCYTQVQSIADQCGHSNTKFRDPDFDIEGDFAAGRNNCLFDLVGSCDGNDSERGKDLPTEGHGLVQVTPGHSKSSDSDDHISIPGSVHRIPWIFRNPRFTISGYSASDVQQGASGDCWWLAALSTIAHRKDLMEKICVMRNEEVGVYGFVFHRDGEWISTVVDDYLYVTESDFDSEIYDATGRKARRHREQKQSGSEALFFAKCGNPNETWLPLLEKAFAKVHGDYQALNGGWSGMAIEDLTGGVTTVVASNSILYKERLWSELLSSGVDGGNFVFALSSGPGETHRNGIVLSHAYSVLEAVEMRKEHGGVSRMLKIRNPWGQRSDSGYGEWHGAWADGSKEWNTYTMDALHHEFGDNGIFWMSYEDVVENFKYIYRTRLFDRGWSMAQKWTSIAVP
ncbi:hypothetical protein FLAG1_08429 [Fusarium langsethiae]|uniref:Calpain catalytic domain-containing protein n=1 Tax=Fusarium langsethiae TaxID=179993 RepID=A0A0M9ES67_FUSLA|nr:hypothetical protein FLAG1_08429 [Fusarium langsethiae]